MRVPRWFWSGALIVTGLLVSCPSVRAQTQIAGTYRCASIKVGKRTKPCTSPPLTLFPDGSYQIWGERGTYTILGKFLVLSESKKRGPGRLQRGSKIVFEYYYQRRKYTVTFRRELSSSPGTIVV